MMTVLGMHRRAIALVALCALVALGGFLASKATQPVRAYPGQNGKISFVKYGANIDVYSINPDGTGTTNLTNHPAFDNGGFWSSDGNELLFLSDRSGSTLIYSMLSDGSSVSAIPGTLPGDQGGMWSPDGSKVVLTATVPVDRPQIFVMNADGTGRTNVSSNGHADYNAKWSPDGTKIVFASVRGTASNEIYVMNANGSGQTRLTTNGSNIVPSWSPDGSKIVYQHGSDIWTMNANGANQVNVSNDPVYATEPVWSPDGTKIAFSSQRDNDYEIYVMNADGSDQVRITNSAGVDFPTDWQPIVCDVAPETDTDGDALPDCWELTGDLDDDGTMDVNLPAMGADPNVKDIFVEVDWMDCAVGGSTGCSSHTTDALACNNPDEGEPLRCAQEELILAFWCAPEKIVLHIDAGPTSIMNPTVDSCETRHVSGPTWGSLAQGAPVAHTLTHYDESMIPPLMQAARIPVFHHGFMQHTEKQPEGYTGYASTTGFWLALGNLTFPLPVTNTELYQRQTGNFMHELGHQLGLMHGGPFSGGEYKPNYLSVMNYSFLGVGLVVNSTINLTFDYSRWSLDQLDEGFLNEFAGLGPDGSLTGEKYYGTFFHCGVAPTPTPPPPPTPTPAPVFDYHVVGYAAAYVDWDCDGEEGSPTPGSCVDPFDNDGDNLINQEDPDCWGAIEASVSHDVNAKSDTTLLGADDWANLDFGHWNIGPAGGAAGGGDGPYFDSVDTSIDLPDNDGDGLLDMAEPENGTGINDPDSDDDGVEDGLEVGVYLTDPLAEDTDGDGCPDGRELGTNKLTGGLRHPRNGNDYFNPTHDGVNRVDDVMKVVQAYFKDDTDSNPGLPPYAPGYDPDTDRTDDPAYAEGWHLLGGNGLQRIDDILAIIKQYFHDCS